MSASFNKGATLIALRPQPALAGRSFSPGDVVPWRNMARAERLVGQMIEQSKLGELTQETFDFAMKQRPPGDIPRGLTAAGLEALGIKVAVAEQPAEPVPEKKPEATVSYDGPPVEHRGYLISGRKRGIGIDYDVFHVDTGAERINPGGMLKGMKNVDKFIDQLETEKARLDKADAPPGLDDENYGDETEPARNHDRDPLVTE